MISTTPDNTELDPRPGGFGGFDGAAHPGVDHTGAPQTGTVGNGVAEPGYGYDPRAPFPPVPPGGSAAPGGAPGRGRYVTVIALAAGLLALAVIGGSLFYLTGSIDVDLTVDGEPQALETRADTVGELLAEQGIEPGADDLITPGLDAELSDGATVEIRYARPFTVIIDGTETEHTTTELTVGAALAAVDAPVENAAISVPLDQTLTRDGATVEIITAKAVSIDDGGQPSEATSTAKTVADLLDDQGITLTETDTVLPPLDTNLTDGMMVTITRITVEEEVRTETIAHDTTETSDGDLTVGTTTVDTEGVDGEREVTYAITYTNGEMTSEESVSSVVTREPVTEVIRVGTKPAPAPEPAASPAPASDPGASPGGEAASLNWPALAECESGGNPKAVNPAGYYGLYQFSIATWQSVGGTGNPADASPAEQLNRAQILYNKAGAGQWPTCGRLLFT